MAVTRVRATRTELIARKIQIQTDSQGRDLLKKKNDVLIARFMEIMKDVVKMRDRVEQVATESNYAHVLAKAIDGKFNLMSASFAVQSDTTIEVGQEKIMGLAVPTVSSLFEPRSLIAQGVSPVSVSSRIEEVSDKFQALLLAILQAADVEIRLKRLAVEIQKTRRRVNALDNVVLPQLKSDIRYINLMLSEREREELYRVKKVKKKIQAKREN